jgi:quercetin dioxygenase-like cupin family protein
VRSIAGNVSVKASIDDLELVEGWYEEDQATRVRFGAAFNGSTGAAASSTYYLEVPPGCRTPWHTHSAEEALYIVDGRAEARINDERFELARGDLAVIPAHAPHGLENIGEEPLRFVAFFSGAAMISVFDQPLQPLGTSVFVTPPPDELPVPVRV